MAQLVLQAVPTPWRLLALATAGWLLAARGADSAPQNSQCYVLKAFSWGMGSSLYNMVVTSAVLRATRNVSQLYIDWSPSPYQCHAVWHGPDWPHFLEHSSVWRPVSHMSDKTMNCTWLQKPDDYNAILIPYMHEMASKHGLQIQEAQFGCSLSEAAKASRQRMLNDLDSVLCPTVRKIWQLSPEVKGLVHYNMLRRWASGAPLIAIHARGTDKLAAGAQEAPDSYRDLRSGLELAQRAHPSLRRGTCVIATDDVALGNHTLAAAQEVFGCTGYMDIDPHRPPYHMNTFPAQSSTLRCAMTLETIMDIELLARSDLTVGMRLSNMDNLASIFRSCFHNKDPRTNMDAVSGLDCSMQVVFWLGLTQVPGR